MKVFLHTFGCKANQYDTELVRQCLGDAGVSIVSDPARADAAVVNSCTVTHTGEARMRALVRRMNRNNPGLKTVVMGCAAAIDDGRIAQLPGVHAVVPGSDPRLVLAAFGYDSGAATMRLRSFARGSRAWLKVQDGCDEHCTFCATTVARGTSRSREVTDILAEARNLAESHAEIVITGVHIGSYGIDLSNRETLGTLLQRLTDEIPDVRFRLSSVEATEVDRALQELMSRTPHRLAPHLHAPLQSGSDRILKLMGRHWYDRASYVERLKDIADSTVHLGLGADVMVGFPGETEQDHAETMAVVEELPFTYLHVFPYSERVVASARKLGPPVAAEIVARRSQELRSAVAHKKDRYCAVRSGGFADVVLTARRNGIMEGLTGDYLSVRVDEAPGLSRFSAELEMRDGVLSASPAVEAVL